MSPNILLARVSGATPASAFPTVAGRTSGINELTTAHPVTLPAAASSGQLILIEIRLSTNLTTITDLDGMTVLGSLSDVDINYVLIRESDGTEGSSISLTTGGTCNTSYVSRLISGWTGIQEVAFTAAAVSTADPPSLTPAAGSAKYLWIAGSGTERGRDATAAPTNYTNLLDISNNPGSGSGADCAIASAERELEAATEDPGAFTWNAVNGGNAWTIAIQGT